MRLSLEITARWKADEVKWPEESVNKGAVVGCELWRNSLEMPSIRQAASFVAARTILIPSWFRSVWLLFNVRRTWFIVGENLVSAQDNLVAAKT